MYQFDFNRSKQRKQRPNSPSVFSVSSCSNLKKQKMTHHRISHGYPPPGHIGQMGQNGKSIGKKATLGSYGRPCGPGGVGGYLLIRFLDHNWAFYRETKTFTASR